MASKRTHSPRGTARTRATDLTPKSQRGQHKIESPPNQAEHPVKAGRNMGGRDITGGRVRGAQGRAGD